MNIAAKLREKMFGKPAEEPVKEEPVKVAEKTKEYRVRLANGETRGLTPDEQKAVESIATLKTSEKEVFTPLHDEHTKPRVDGSTLSSDKKYTTPGAYNPQDANIDSHDAISGLGKEVDKTGMEAKHYRMNKRTGKMTERD